MKTVDFTLPSLPGSVNRIYVPGYSIYSQKPEWSLSPDWMQWQARMMPYIKRLPEPKAEMSIIQVDRCFYYPWFYKNKKWRKADAANMDKLLFDTLAKKLGIDDLFFKRGMLDSRNSESGKVYVRLTEIGEEEWLSQQENDSVF